MDFQFFLACIASVCRGKRGWKKRKKPNIIIKTIFLFLVRFDSRNKISLKFKVKTLFERDSWIPLLWHLNTDDSRVDFFLVI